MNLTSNEMEIYQREFLEEANWIKRAEISKHWESIPSLLTKLNRVCLSTNSNAQGQHTALNQNLI